MGCVGVWVGLLVSYLSSEVSTGGTALKKNVLAKVRFSYGYLTLLYQLWAPDQPTLLT